VWNELEDLAVATLDKSQKNFEQIVADASLLKKQRLPKDEAFMFMGMLLGYNVISLRQSAVLKKEWLRPSHPEFEERTMWSFFNVTTESLKTCPPVTIMEKHAQAYTLLVKGLPPAGMT